MKIFYFLVILFSAQLSFSQQSGLKGQIIEESTGKTLPGAIIRIENTTLVT